MGGIAYQNKDIASKITAESMLGKTLEAFGFPNLKVVKLLPTNLQTIESNELRMDNLFQLEDGSIAIIDYESAFTKENFVKYLSYAARVLKRYASEGKLDPDYAARIKEEMHMTQVGQLIFNDGWEAGLAKGRSEGEAKGRPEGEKLKLIEQIQKKHRKGKSPAAISRELETSKEEIRPILDCVMKYPDAGKEEILEYLRENE